MGQEEGTHSPWNTGWDFLPVLRIIYLYIYYSLCGEFHPCHWDKTWIWDKFGHPILDHTAQESPAWGAAPCAPLNIPDSSSQAQASPGEKIPYGFVALGWEISIND